MVVNVLFKASASENGAKAVCAVAKAAVKITTNPIAMGGAVVLGLGYMVYKHEENKDKRKYEYSN